MEQRDGSSAGQAHEPVENSPKETPLAELEGLTRFRKFKQPGMRLLQRLMLVAIPLFALLFNFEIPSHFTTPMLQEQYLGMMLVLVLGSVFLSIPASRGASRTKAPWYDLFLALVSLVVGGYLVLFYPDILNEMGELTPNKVLLGAAAVLVVMEACRRMTGWSLVVIAAVFILYAHYAYLFPGLLHARSISWSKLAVHLYIDPNALLGTPLAIVSTVVVAFILFGQVLFASGGGEFFTDLATSLLGRFRGGAAKISVLASALFGTISGSAVANVVVDGAITIPLMIRTGYRPHVAGAVEAVASNGGQIMPPVMGAAAFVMAEFLGMPYAQVALAALIPALLYYLALFVQIDLEAGKTGITRIPREKIPSAMGVVKNGWVFIIPMALIIYILFVLNLQASKAGFYAAAVALAVTFFRRDLRIGFAKLVQILEDTGLAVLEVAVVCAVAGIVEGLLTLTGLAFVFTLFVEQLGTGNIWLILMLTAFVALFLGMPMPTTAVYVLVALTLAPALIKLGIPPIAAHMFVFYYAMLSLITPPIATAAFAAAAIAGTAMMRTGWACMRLGIIAYVIPFIFVMDPLLLLQGPPHLVGLALATAAVGTAAVAAAMVGYFVRPLGWLKRASLTLAGIGLLVPPGGTVAYSWGINGVGGILCLGIILYEWRARHIPAVSQDAAAQI
ncbi:MAG: TRAP transporter fused permease subunit [Deltaproteobacteria bacterium]|nr:TRAP transporter fused permease subunit [Deltaproteobacteria bacterium]